MFHITPLAVVPLLPTRGELWDCFFETNLYYGEKWDNFRLTYESVSVRLLPLLSTGLQRLSSSHIVRDLWLTKEKVSHTRGPTPPHSPLIYGTRQPNMIVVGFHNVHAVMTVSTKNGTRQPIMVPYDTVWCLQWELFIDALYGLLHPVCVRSDVNQAKGCGRWSIWANTCVINVQMWL